MSVLTNQCTPYAHGVALSASCRSSMHFFAQQARLRNDVLREAASTDMRLLVAREAARGSNGEGIPDGDMEDDFEPVTGVRRGPCRDRLQIWPSYSWLQERTCAIMKRLHNCHEHRQAARLHPAILYPLWQHEASLRHAMSKPSAAHSCGPQFVMPFVWMGAGPAVVQTPLDVYESLVKEGFRVDYYRVPLTDGRAPKARAPTASASPSEHAYS